MQNERVKTILTVADQIPTVQEKFGLSIIKVSQNKVPFEAWAEYKTEENPIENWHGHFLKNGHIGIICGKVSGNLEILDFDLKNDPQKTIFNDFASLIPDELLNKLVKQTTKNGGFHLIYRCPTGIEGSQKLAHDNTGEVIIETRGEGAYFSHHQVYYRVTNGVFDMINLTYEIPEITAEERELMLTVARSLNRKVNRISEYQYNENAINRFNKEYNILEQFEQHGWEIAKEDDDKVYLNRPNSSTTHSAYYYKDTNTFICFSSSTAFLTSKPYNHYQVLQVLENEKDFKKLYQRLEDLGFHMENIPTTTQRNTQRITPDQIAEYLNNVGVRYDAFIQDLTLDSEVITEIQYNTLSINLKKHYNIEIPRAKFEEVIKSTYISQHDPVLSFIENHQHCNSSNNFEQWIHCLELKNKDVKESTIVYFFKKWYVGMIAQALGGLYPNEFFLSLISSKQGIGKTSMLRNNVLPSDLQKYVLEHALSFDDDFKVIMGQGMLIIDDEMDSRTYEAEKSFKNLLSTKVLTIRRSYDRRISNIVRRASFAGSGNNIFIVKEHQNRRILPIEVEKIHFDRLNNLKLDELFMEAYRLYKDGFKYSFEHSDTPLLEELFADYRQVSDLDLVFDEYIEVPRDEKDVFHIASLDLLQVLNEKFGKLSKMINAKAIGNLMVELKIERLRKGSTKATCYCISKNSNIIKYLPADAISWTLNNNFQKPIIQDEDFGYFRAGQKVDFHPGLDIVSK